VPSYTVTDLGTLGGDFSEGWSVNAFGEVAGRSQVAAFPHPYHAFRYSGGGMTDLDTLGSTYSSGDAINDAGQVAGSAFVSGVNTHAFLFGVDGSALDLGTLGGDTSAAFGINNRGWVVGQAAVTGTYLTHAFLYRHGHMTDLGTLGGDRSAALAVNDAGWVVGGSDAPGGVHAFLWRHGHITDLGTLGGSVSSAQAVNALGQVAGDSDLAYTPSGFFPHHAFLWEQGQFTDLGTLGGFYSYAYGLNDYGQVVGYAAVPDNTSAPFLYADGTMTNLNDLIPPDWTLSQARGINDAGQIVGYGSSAQGGVHALLLSPDENSAPHARTAPPSDADPRVVQVAVALPVTHHKDRMPGGMDVVPAGPADPVQSRQALELLAGQGTGTEAATVQSSALAGRLRADDHRTAPLAQWLSDSVLDRTWSEGDFSREALRGLE
jgi:probable HAF family extracellular repeat protein